MNSEFKITSEKMQTSVPVTVFHVSGWLDAQSEGQLLETARLAHDEGARHLLIDMGELDTLTSAGMRAIQKVYHMYVPAGTQGKAVKLCNAPPQIYNVLSITGFLQNLPMYESLEAALESFQEE
jgi:anti-anti-sigma factor